MSELTVKTLGGIRFHRDTGEFRPPTRKAAALLIYLGLSPRGSRSREHLAGVLWGRSADEQSRASLRQTLSSLRKALGEQTSLLQSDADAVGIDRDRLEIDALEFERLANSASHADLEHAAEMYQGAFLEGFSLKEEGFEDWLAFNRQQYNEIALQLFQRLVEHYRMLQEYETAVRYAQRLLSLDPLREQTHRLLMELFARLGRREQALLQYDDCERILKKELNVEPAPATRELYASIRSGTTVAPGKLPDSGNGVSAAPPAADAPTGKPGIAVLPFDNLSGDPAQQYLADAITEDLVSNLAHDLWFDVIAQTSTQKFKDNKTGTADIAAELGARYIVDGSLRKAGDRIRVAVVLIDGSDGRQIWDQRYDRVTNDLFELQDEIAISIAAAVIPEVNIAEQRSAMRKHPQNLDAWSCCHRAFAHLYTFDLAQLEMAHSMFKQAIEHDPSYSQPYAGLAYSQMMTVWYDSSKKDMLDTAIENARRAVQLDNRDSWAHFALGRILSMQRQYDEATLELETAIELNPSFGRAYFGLASVAVYSARYTQAQAPIDTAIRLSPADPHLWTFYNIKARALTGLEQYEEAEYWARKAVRQPSATFWCDLALVSVLGYLGREDEAHLAIQELYRKKPGYSLEQYTRDDFVLTPVAHQLVVEGLRRAGLQERASEAADTPNRPSIAVLPFRNLGDDPEQVYFSDGVTEEVITALSRFRWLLVISSNSSFRYRMAKTESTDVAEELDVRYVVTGSVRKHGNRVRVAAQLIDVETEHQIWADRYDREIDNLFEVQDEIASNIISAVAPESLAAEIKRAENARCCTLDAWELIMQAHSHWRKLTREDNELAKQLLRQATELESDAAFAYSDLAFCYVFDSMFSWVGEHDQSLLIAEQAARKAISIDDRDALGYMALGWVAHKKRDQEVAEDAMRNATSRNPNLADAYGYLAMILGFKGDYSRAEAEAQRALRLSPHDPMKTFWFDALAMAAFVSGDYPLAVEWAEKAVQENSSYVGALRVLAASYGQTGQIEAAEPVVDTILELVPGMTCAETALGMPFRNTYDEKRYLQGLRQAGLPDRKDEDRPSIAVLPFSNLSGDPAQQYFSDGFSEEVLNGLTRIRSFKVVARNSSFAFRDSSETAPEIGHKLGARYLVNGSLRKSGEQLRIAVQLVDSQTNSQIWSDRYDGVLDDVFDLQDRISVAVIGAIEPKIRTSEIEKIRRAVHLGAYELYLKALSRVYEMTRESTDEALPLLDQAIQLDGEFYRALSLVAWCCTLRPTQGWLSRDSDEAGQAIEMARRALAGEPDNPEVLWQAGYSIWFFSDALHEGVEHVDRSLELNPNSAQAWVASGWIRLFSGDPQTAIEHHSHAIELSPMDPIGYRPMNGIAAAYVCLGEYERAEQWSRKALALGPNYHGCYRVLATSLAYLGRTDEASGVIKKYLELVPQVSIAYYRKHMPWKDDRYREIHEEGLRRAGLPEVSAAPIASD